jgi:protein TonB
MAMSTLLLSQPALPPLNWPRVGAWSGSLSLHCLAAALLLLPPAALQLLRRPPAEPVVVRLLDPPEVVTEVPLPVPPKRLPVVERSAPKPPRALQRLPIDDVAVVRDATFSRAADIDLPPAPSAANPPADTAPTALAYLTRTPLPYPLDAARRREQGTVILRVLVGSDGVPQQVEIETSSGSHSLDESARDAVRRWTFQPGTRAGVAAALWARIPIAFRLDRA